MSKIWVVAGISVEAITPEREALDFEIIRHRHSSWRGKNIEDYRKWTASWQEDRWKIEAEDAAYFLDVEEAIQAAKENIGDLNDGGVYNYACVYPIETGAYMPRCEIPDEEIILFLYVHGDNAKTDSRYVPLVNEDGKVAAVWKTLGQKAGVDVQYYGMTADDKLLIQRMKNTIRGCIGG